MPLINYSIIMPYYRRKIQLFNTIASLRDHYNSRFDWELIIVEDIKNAADEAAHASLFETLEYIPSHFRIKHIIAGELNWSNPAPLFNAGVQVSEGKNLVITNPECFHINNILGGLDREFELNPDVYVVCACESAGDFTKWTLGLTDFKWDHHMWYQHSKHRNELYHFCSSISRENYDHIGGFDDEFALGIGYDDNDFRDSIITAGIKVITRDDLLVIHQKHSKHSTRTADYRKRLKRNKELYEKKHILQTR